MLVHSLLHTQEFQQAEVELRHVMVETATIPFCIPGQVMKFGERGLVQALHCDTPPVGLLQLCHSCVGVGDLCLRGFGDGVVDQAAVSE